MLSRESVQVCFLLVLSLSLYMHVWNDCCYYMDELMFGVGTYMITVEGEDDCELKRLN